MRTTLITACLAGAAALALLGFAAVDLMAAAGSDGSAPHVGGPGSERGLWGLVDELCRLPEHQRNDRAQRIADVLREDRVKGLKPIVTPDTLPSFELVETPTTPEAAVPVAGDAMPSSAAAIKGLSSLGDLLEVYRNLSPDMKRRLQGLSDEEMMRAVERFARAERALDSAMGK
ncbi:MAG: hypothetical protein ACYTGX_08945 [Planctomycetota bacterium]|jgi:hypothetical protein